MLVKAAELFCKLPADQQPANATDETRYAATDTAISRVLSIWPRVHISGRNVEIANAYASKDMLKGQGYRWQNPYWVKTIEDREGLIGELKVLHSSQTVFVVADERLLQLI